MSERERTIASHPVSALTALDGLPQREFVVFNKYGHRESDSPIANWLRALEAGWSERIAVSRPKPDFDTQPALDWLVADPRRGAYAVYLISVYAGGSWSGTVDIKDGFYFENHRDAVEFRMRFG